MPKEENSRGLLSSDRYPAEHGRQDLLINGYQAAYQISSAKKYVDTSVQNGGIASQ